MATILFRLAKPSDSKQIVFILLHKPLETQGRESSVKIQEILFIILETLGAKNCILKLIK